MPDEWRTPPTSSPIAPTFSPAVQPPSDDGNVCQVATCTRSVLETMACNDSSGGCYTCESRINYLINDMKQEVMSACKTIGFDQFPVACGGCMPDEMRTPGTLIRDHFSNTLLVQQDSKPNGISTSHSPSRRPRQAHLVGRVQL